MILKQVCSWQCKYDIFACEYSEFRKRSLGDKIFKTIFNTSIMPFCRLNSGLQTNYTIFARKPKKICHKVSCLVDTANIFHRLYNIFHKYAEVFYEILSPQK